MPISKQGIQIGLFLPVVPPKNRGPSHKPTFCHATVWETSQAALWWHKWHPDRSIGHRCKSRGDRSRCPNTLASALPKTATLIKPKGSSMLSMASRFLQMRFLFKEVSCYRLNWCFTDVKSILEKSLLQVLWYECDDKQQQIWGLCHGRSPHNEIKQTNKREQQFGFKLIG